MVDDWIQHVKANQHLYTFTLAYAVQRIQTLEHPLMNLDVRLEIEPKLED